MIGKNVENLFYFNHNDRHIVMLGRILLKTVYTISIHINTMLKQGVNGFRSLV